MFRKLFLLLTIFIFAVFNCGFVNVKVLDVGQGDSILIQTENQNILVDTGNYSARNTLPFLLRLNHALKIDKLILTHPHSDHIANAALLINSGYVSEVFDNGKISNNKFYLNYLKACQNMAISKYSLQDGDFISLDNGAVIKILSADSGNENFNNSSIVAKLIYGDFSTLLTGDAEVEIEDELCNSDKNLKSAVLKAAHHGSKSSNSFDFVCNVQPQFVIISAGKNNRFHHPHKISLENFLTAGVPHDNIFCTAFNGTISIFSDGKNFSVTPERKINWLDKYLGYKITVTKIVF